ncbi:MAG TPA: alginate export family protein [Candidatus Acidoferrales bacterium]|nr:alginate export family protein [Candidatus Acidoferrales bacterium]
MRLSWATGLLLLAGFAGDIRAQLVENAQYDITGVWSGGILRGATIDPAEADVQPGEIEIEGRISALDPRQKILQIGPVTVEWSESTKFVRLKREALKVGASVEIECQLLGPRRVRATVIERADAAAEPNYLRIMAAVNNVKENPDGSARLDVIGVPVILPAEVYRALRGSRAEPDEEEDEETRGTALKIFGEYEVKFDYQNNFALDRRQRSDVLHLDQEFQLRLFYPYNDWVSLLVEGKLFAEHEIYRQRGGRKSEFALERGETWVRFDRLFGHNLTLKIGRQSFEEPRRWWWDDELDAIGIRFRAHPWFVQLGVARELLPESTSENFVDPENEGVLRVLARADWRYADGHRLSLFFLHQHDSSRTPATGAFVRKAREDESDARLWWGGLRAMGLAIVAGYGEFSYWADAAVVGGEEKLLDLEGAGHRKLVVSRRRQRVLGWAVDFGGRWATPLPARPAFILGYALGSGDKSPEKGSDRAFRQTGLQANDEEFRTYGELLRPELSNLGVAVWAVQLPLLSESHVEFAYRHFRQHHAAPFLRDGRIEAEPNGRNKTIGQEWMVYFGFKEWKNVEIEVVGAAFRAGRAYGTLSGKTAYSFFTQVTYEF